MRTARNDRESRNILIVDDDGISCAVLKHILEDSYYVITASDGKEALELLNGSLQNVSLIFLDLKMPVMGGYVLLDMIEKDPKLSLIPVIVTSSKDQEEDEIRCLENGAVDFITKPYHPEIVKKRVDGIIHLRETAAFMNMLEYDQLTGLYSRNTFYMEVDRLLAQEPIREYDMLVADVENFKAVNERLGVKAGDRVLCRMADKYRKLLGNHGICARLHADVFAVLIEHGDGSWKKRMLWQWDEKEEGIPPHNLVIKYGIYENVSRRITPFGMCDRAVLALNQIKSRYGKYVFTYDDSLRAELMREQRILDTMEQALKEKQFQIYFQPKYDINSEYIAGAEVVVRWQHPEYGFMTPSEFIPLFEYNGFITKLDFYVWEETCRCLHKWKIEGLKQFPISVNISRMDFSVPDLAEQITAMADRYEVDRELLHLEITESAYTEEPQHIINMVNHLRENGFKIEMDDFGSGYSSLNMLSELSVDYIKLDMKFIQKKKDNRKSILGFIISLSKWLNLVTIAKGVETREQIDTLRRFGCDYVQGYYYAEPMPQEDFERYLRDNVGKIGEADQEAGNAVIEEIVGLSAGKKEKILIVDDNEMNRTILRSMLEQYYYVEETADGQEAYEYLKQHPGEISAILLDMVMPVMDGFQFMKLKNQDKEISGIPVIVTSETDDDSELMALRMGAARFAGKPYQRELILLAIRNAIDHWG